MSIPATSMTLGEAALAHAKPSKGDALDSLKQ
jgi:hypothetical protein